jgi:tetratricopeptide (TPR) repeat protein
VNAQKASQDILNQAQMALDNNRLEEAALLLREILEIDKNNHLARKALIDVLMRLMQWDEAKKHVTTLRSQYPEDSQAAFLAAAVAFRVGEFSQAVELSDEALALKNPLDEALRIRALGRFMLQDYDGYIKDMHSLIDRNPLNPDPHYHLGRYYFEIQIFKTAEEEFLNAIRKSPRHYKALYYLGWCQRAGGDLEKAKANYRKSIDIIQDEGVSFGWPFSDLGEILITQDSFDEGLNWLYSGVRNDPDLPYVHFKYASALFKKETNLEVESELLKAIELDPGYTEAYYILANYYRKTGDRESALEALKKFQELRKNPVASTSGVRRN